MIIIIITVIIIIIIIKTYPSYQDQSYYKFQLNSFTSLDAEDSTSGPLNREGIADSPLLRTLLAVRQKSREPSFRKSFVLLA